MEHRRVLDRRLRATFSELDACGRSTGWPARLRTAEQRLLEVVSALVDLRPGEPAGPEIVARVDRVIAWAGEQMAAARRDGA